MADSLIPITAARNTAYTQMPERLKRVANQCEKFLTNHNRHRIESIHQIGTLVNEVKASETEYGVNSLTLLAAYLNMPEGISTLNNFALIAASFTQQFVLEQTEKPLADNSYLSMMHWRALATVKDQNAVLRYLKIVRDHAYSAKELQAIIDSSSDKKSKRKAGAGRPIRRAPNAAVGVARYTRSAQTLIAIAASVSEAQFLDSLAAKEELEPETITQLEQLQERLEKLREVVVADIKHLNKVISRRTKK